MQRLGCIYTSVKIIIDNANLWSEGRILREDNFNLKVKIPHVNAPDIHPLEVELLRLLASPARLEICELLRKGVDHPEDLAARLKVSRQSVDKHLLALHERGIVERSAVFPTDGRPRVVYAVSSAAGELMNRMEESLKTYVMTRVNEFHDTMVVLDDDLASGRLDEEAYLKRRKTLKAHYAPFLELEREDQPC